MYKKKKFEKRYLLLAILVVIIIVIGISAFALRNERNLSVPEKVVKDSSTFIINTITSPFKLVKNKITDYNEYKKTKENYKQLKAKADKYDSLKAENNNLNEEIEKLKKLNDVKALTDKVYLNAAVINRNIGYWYNEITIDKGSKNGIKKEMPVIVNEGLIGLTSKVSYTTTTVKLLTSEHFSDKISVKIKSKDKYIYGLLSGYNKKEQTYTVEGISENTEIEKSSEVVTTGMSENFPSGLYIGKVVGGLKDNFDLSKELKVKTEVDYNDITYVTVLKRNNQ